MLKEFHYIEKIEYPNGGYSLFYEKGEIALIIDFDICRISAKSDAFPYSLITDKQNEYMKRYHQVFRLLNEDVQEQLPQLLQDSSEEYEVVAKSFDRGNTADSSPLELLFEKNFTNVYGMSSLKYLQKEFGISDRKGNQYFLDYVIHTNHGDIAVEENGVTYHHPQVIGLDRYRRQLQKQNACAEWNMKIYRFSTEDCQFEDRIEDDIRNYFGDDCSGFLEQGILLDRKIELYEHQKITLEDIQEKRRQGVHSFLIVFPTASGKSRIVEEDIKMYEQEHPEFRALILAPGLATLNDWNERVKSSFSEFNDRIEIRSFAYMMRHYQEYKRNTFDYNSLSVF